MTTVSQFTFFDNFSGTTEADSPILPIANGEAVVLGVKGTFEGTLEVKAQLNDAWTTVTVVSLADVTTAESITAAGLYTVPCAWGYNALKVTATLTSGSISVVGKLCRSV